MSRGKVEGFYTVGMGAWAGGLEAFEAVFRNMPENPGMAFVVVPHLDPTHISILPQLVQKCTKMKVMQITDGLKVLPNTVYIVPPNKDLGMLHGTLQLVEPTGSRAVEVAHQLFFPVFSTGPKRKSDLYCSIRHGDGRHSWPESDQGRSRDGHGPRPGNRQI